MKKAIILSIVLWPAYAFAQIDTLGQYPHFYYYNFPELGIYHQDSVFCSVATGASRGLIISDSAYFYTVSPTNEVAIQFHSDDTLRIIGIAYLASVKYVANVLTLRDDGMHPLASTTSLYEPTYLTNYTGVIYADTGYLLMNIPGLWTNFLGGNCAVRMTYFDNPMYVDVVGDFYIGGTTLFSTPEDMVFSVIKEHHDPPHYFSSWHIKFYKTDSKEWVDQPMNSHVVPLVFPIVELPCLQVDEVRVTEEGGCVVAEWDSVELQDQWVVELTTSAGLTVIDTVDSCHYEFCGLMEDEDYRVKVRSRCIRSRCEGVLTHHWSPWSAPVGTLGIEATLPSGDGLQLAPNPAMGKVTVTLPQGARCLTVHSVDGREVYRNDTPAETLDIDVSHWVRGVYTVGIENDRGTTARKLVVE